MDQLLAKAVTIALEAHKGATDKAGMPYAGHIMRVMQAGRTNDEKTNHTRSLSSVSKPIRWL